MSDTKICRESGTDHLFLDLATPYISLFEEDERKVFDVRGLQKSQAISQHTRDCRQQNDANNTCVASVTA